MKNILKMLTSSLLMLLLFTGCAVGDKAMSLSIIYGATTILSLLLLISYCILIHDKDSWFFLLFSSVFVVNAGYLSLALSTSVSEALLANRIAYFGSAFLPLAMLMIIINVCGFRAPIWLTSILASISAAMFLVAASPGYSDIYYRSSFIETINGVTVLVKVYGPWHKLYLVYLLSYFAAMIAVILYASSRQKLNSQAHAISLAGVTMANIGVWLLGQLVDINFEFLSVSYIFSELYLLCIYLMIQESRHTPPNLPNLADVALPEDETDTAIPDDIDTTDTASMLEHYQHFASQLCSLTPTERTIYELYLSGKNSREIMEKLTIKENTLKYHNKNIYSKLGVSSRKQMLDIASKLSNINL